MRSFFKAKKLLFAYTVLVSWIFLALAFRIFISTNFITFSITFLLLLILPGFSLARLFSFDLKGLSERLVLYSSIGFVYAFLLISLSILTSLTINTLLIVYLILMGGLFLAAFLKDLYGRNPKEFSFNYRKVFHAKNLSILIFGLVVGAYFLLISAQGSNFKGDPLFHLSYVQKAISGQALSIDNLSFVKNTLHIAYGFPIWHVFVALVSKIENLDVFGGWYLMIAPLFLLTILAWYFIFRLVLKSRLWAFIAVFFFLSFMSNQAGYIFTRLAVPDTLNQVLLLPLLVGISLKFIFDKAINYKILGVILTLSLFIGLIHAVQYFYYLAIIITFALAYLVCNFWRKNFWDDLKKILLLVAINLSAIFIVLIVLQLKSHFVSENINLFFNTPRSLVYKMDWTFLLFVPPLLWFNRQNPRVSFILASLLVVPLISIRAVQQFIVRLPNIGSVFLDRIPQNVTWPFLFWALVLGFLIMIFDRFFNLVKTRSLKMLLNIFLVLAAGILVWLQFGKNPPDFYLIWTQPVANWFYAHLTLAIIVLTVISVGLLIWQHFSARLKNGLEKLESQHHLSVALLLIIFFLTIIPSWRGNLSLINSKTAFASPQIIRDRLVDITTFGGQDGYDFIRNNLPPKSVFLVFSGQATSFASLFDQFIVGYPQSPELAAYQTIYDPSVDFSQKIPLLKQGNIDYILLVHTEVYNPQMFDSYPIYLTKIYNKNQTAIYLVKKVNL